MGVAFGLGYRLRVAPASIPPKRSELVQQTPGSAFRKHVKDNDYCILIIFSQNL